MNMSGVVRQELFFFAASVLAGLTLSWFYDLLRLLRRLVPHPLGLVSAEDFLYWCMAGVAIFAMIFRENDGALRGYAFAGILTGAWMEYFIKSFFYKIWIKLLKKHENKGKMTEDAGK